MATNLDTQIKQLEAQLNKIISGIQNSPNPTPKQRQERDALRKKINDLKDTRQTEITNNPLYGMSESDIALQKYGFAYGLIQSDESLSTLFKNAIDQTYTPQRFAAELRGTNWYQSQTESKRNYEILKSGDPTTFQQIAGSWSEWVTNQASTLGAKLSPEQISSFADQLMQGGISEDKALKIFASTYVDYSSADLAGRAGALQDSLNIYSRQYGDILNQSQVNNYVKQVLSGTMTESDVLDGLRRASANTYTNFSERIMGGETVEDISSPYRNIVANLLEVGDVDLQDNLMMDALTGKNDKGGMKYSSLSDFKKAVKADERWQFTDNAREEYFGIAQKVLADFGFLG
jgi:hypothetical protein